MRLQHLNLIFQLVYLFRRYHLIQPRLPIIFRIDNQRNLLLLNLFHHINRLLYYFLFINYLLLFLLNLQVEFIIFRDGASQFNDDGFECLHLALLDIYLGLGLFKQSLQLRDSVLSVHFRLVFNITGTLTESKG
jgi:hypothetical protein